MTPDKYQRAVDYFMGLDNVDRETELLSAWSNPHEHPHGCLFYFLTPTRFCKVNDCEYGCPTLVKGGGDVAYWPELTDAVRWDDDMPDWMDETNCTRLNLEAFARIQRLADLLRAMGERK